MLFYISRIANAKLFCPDCKSGRLGGNQDEMLKKIYNMKLSEIYSSGRALTGQALRSQDLPRSSENAFHCDPSRIEGCFSQFVDG